MTSSQHGPYAWGFTHATMAGTEGPEPARGLHRYESAFSAGSLRQVAIESRHELTTAMQHLCTSPEGKVCFDTGLVHVKSG